MESLDPADPRSVGGYPIFARLGAGGMGQVYLARTPAGRPLALKTVRSEFGLDPSFGERFAREIRHADRVRSPWTVAVVDFSPPGSRPQWLATEYVAAPSLADRVAAGGPLPERAVGALAAELSEALHAVHQAGLAHRDVKPSNVLLSRARPLLIDFGIARAAEDSRHTSTGGVIGSPGFMAPEQATAGVSGESGDLFALGAVLVYAATGHGPFSHPGEDPSAPALLYRIVHEDPDLTGVPGSLAPLIRACLQKDPELRPSARDMADALRTAGHSAGDWAAEPPQGLEEDVLAREADVRATLGEPIEQVRQKPAVRDLGPSPYAPRTAAPGPTGPYRPPAPRPQQPVRPQPVRPQAQPPARQQPGPQQQQQPTQPYAPRPVPAPAPRPAAAGWQRPAPNTPAAPRWNGTGPQGAPRPQPVRPSGGLGGAKVAIIVVGVVVALGVIGAVANQLGGKGDDNGGSPTPTTNGTNTTDDGYDDTTVSADALPAAWYGTWVGQGPGDASPANVTQPRTDRFIVTLTLHAGSRGQVVGGQVSNIREIGTGDEVGCTESLRLNQLNGREMVFQAVGARTTDPSSDGYCPVGNIYTVDMTSARTLALGAGSQTSGSPRTFTKSG